MAIAHVASATSKTANNNSNTTLTVTLGSTTAGHLNVIDIVAQCGTASTNVGFNTPSGWTKVGESFDTTATGPVTMATFYRFFVGGDASTVAVTWTTAGQAVAGASGYSGVDTTTPIPTSSLEPKGTTDASYSASMTTGVAGWVRSGFGNRSGHTYSAMADTSRGSDSNASAVSIAFQDSAADVSSGTITRTATGSGTTSIGAEWVYLLQPAAAGGTNYSWTVDEGLSLGETIATSTLATIDTVDDTLGLTDTVSRVLNTGVDPSRIPDFTFLVELAPAATPATSAPSYLDVTSYVLLSDSATLSRGREDEGSTDAQPGRASWTMANSGGAFTPGDTGSAFAPFQLRRPFRWSVTVDGRSYTLWQGFLDSVDAFRDGTTAKVRLSCSDRIARLGKAVLPRLADYEVGSDVTTASYVMPLRGYDFLRPGGSLGAIATSTTTIGETKTPGGSLTFSSGNGVGGEESDAVAEFRRASTSSGQFLAVNGNGYTSFPTTWTIEAMVNPSTLTAMVAVATGQYDQYRAVQYASLLGISSSGVAYFQSADPVNPFTLFGTSRLVPNAWNHIAVTGNITTPLATLYVNGVAEATRASAISSLVNDVLFVGGVPDYTSYSTWAPFDGYVAYAGWVNAELSSTRIAAHASTMTGYSGEVTTARFSRVMARTSTPSALYAAPTAGNVRVGAQQIHGRSALDVINEITSADGGFVYADSDGIVQYAAPATRYNAAVGVTLDAAKSGQLLSDVEFETNDALLVNSITYTAADGSIVTSSDTTSIASFDTHDLTATIPVLDASIAGSVASWVLATRATPTPRSNRIDINVVGYKASGGNVAQLLAAEVGTRLRVTNLPDDLTPSNTLDLFVEGITHRISKGEWVMSLTTSPVGRYGQAFTINDATNGVIDGSTYIVL